MAPEIMLEGRVSKAADVYAFGITLWVPWMAWALVGASTGA